MEIIGRQREKQILAKCEASGKPEFIAVYGRRRVGKTYLITQHFDNKFTFQVTGVSSENMADQLESFYTALKKYFKNVTAHKPTSWFQAFNILEECLREDRTPGRKVLFIDEMPWLDTPKSKFITALEHFWNSYASMREQYMLIVCGSSASWIIRKLLQNYGGLYNRVTERIVLEPFCLYECEEFYRSRGIILTRQQIAEAYMILGGIPFYMSAMSKMYGLSQNIDMLLFKKNAILSNEFDSLYHSLFRFADSHITIAETLSEHTSGMTRQELAKACGISSGGGLSKALGEMEACGLINRYYDYSKKRGGDIYKLTDFYTLFYFSFLKDKRSNDPHFWTNILSHPAHSTWRGFAFERLCMAHIQQIKQKLGISGVITETYAFRVKGTTDGDSVQKKGAQIDIVIDRRDNVVNLCECKFSDKPYMLTQQDVYGFNRKKEVFRLEIGSKKALHITMITANGLVFNAHCNDIQAEITLDDLFQPEI